MKTPKVVKIDSRGIVLFCCFLIYGNKKQRIQKDELVFCFWAWMGPSWSICATGLRKRKYRDRKETFFFFLEGNFLKVYSHRICLPVCITITHQIILRSPRGTYPPNSSLSLPLCNQWMYLCLTSFSMLLCLLFKLKLYRGHLSKINKDREDWSLTFILYVLKFLQSFCPHWSELLILKRFYIWWGRNSKSVCGTLKDL